MQLADIKSYVLFHDEHPIFSVTPVFFLFVFVGFFCGVHIGSFYLLCMTSFLPYLHFCVMYFIKFVTLGIYLVFVQLLHSGHVLGF